MQLDGLLTFLYGLLEVAFTYLAALLVADGVERQHLREVVLVAVLFLERTVDVGKRTIIICVIASLE